jgi:hypothetical protein
MSIPPITPVCQHRLGSDLLAHRFPVRYSSAFVAGGIVPTPADGAPMPTGCVGDHAKRPGVKPSAADGRTLITDRVTLASTDPGPG